MASSNMKKLEGTEMKMCRTKSPREKCYHQGETGGNEHHREVQKNETDVVLTHEETRPRNRR